MWLQACETVIDQRIQDLTWSGLGFRVIQDLIATFVTRSRAFKTKGSGSWLQDPFLVQILYAMCFRRLYARINGFNQLGIP
ncbi:hypothetical protein VNO77_33703 [Canavalia gladiata]|uniref:Uncharacterized protein n=1 Tax=Canavalia gladiata TaxID=3824 RepID=A0AAN9PWM1_CANGL